jgi:HlyD family secretion protein
MSEPDARIVAVPGQPAPPHQAASHEGGEVEIRAESRPSTALVPVRQSRFPRPPRPPRRHLALLAVLILVAALIGGYLYRQRAGSLPHFQTARVELGALIASISATGTLNAVITVQVGSQVSGQIKALYADFNSRVSRGQVIALIDQELFQAQVNQAKAQADAARAGVLNQRAVVAKTRADLENARAALAVAHAQVVKAQVAVVDGERNLGRQRELHGRNLIAQADLDAAQVAYESAVAQHDAVVAQERAQGSAVESADAQLSVANAQLVSAQAQVLQYEAMLQQTEVNLDHTVIRAPVDGVVVSRNVDVGQTVAASLQAPTLFLIAQDLTKMQVDTNVDEADVGRVRVDQPVSFSVDAFPGKAFAGKVVQVREAPQVIQNVVTYDVVVSAPNPELKLLPGMTANVRILTDQKDGVLKIPNASLRFRPPGADSGPPAPGAGSAPRTASSPPGNPSTSVARAGLPGEVWVVAADGSPRSVSVQVGISDGFFTEVIGGDLKENQPVIVGIEATDTKASPSTGGRSLRF